MLVTLRQIVQAVSTATRLDDALGIIVHRVKEALPIDACAVYLTDVESNQYVLMAADGFNPASIGEVRINRQEGLVGLVGEQGALITVPDAAAIDGDRRQVICDACVERSGDGTVLDCFLEATHRPLARIINTAICLFCWGARMTFRLYRYKENPE